MTSCVVYAVEQKWLNLWCKNLMFSIKQHAASDSASAQEFQLSPDDYDEFTNWIAQAAIQVRSDKLFHIIGLPEHYDLGSVDEPSQEYSKSHCTDLISPAQVVAHYAGSEFKLTKGMDEESLRVGSLFGTEEMPVMSENLLNAWLLEKLVKRMRGEDAKSIS